MNVYESIQEMIGGTPLVRLSGYGQKRKLKAEILGTRPGASRTAWLCIC